MTGSLCCTVKIADFLFLPLLMEECSPVIPHHLLGLTDAKGEVIWLAPLRQISLDLPTGGLVASGEATTVVLLVSFRVILQTCVALVRVMGRNRGQRVQKGTKKLIHFLTF